MAAPNEFNDSASQSRVKPIVCTLVASIFVLVVGIFMFARTAVPLWFLAAWVVLAVVATTLNIVGLVRARRPSDARTGVRLAPAPPNDSQLVPPPPRRWVGGANAPGRFGRTNATAPFTVLELNGAEVVLRLRPTLLAKLFGGPDRFVARNTDGVEIFPAIGLLRSPGVGFNPPGEAMRYFWTSRRQREEVLSALANAGFSVSWDERRFRY